MEISAQLVKQLRERTGAGMMECKKALVESKGDLGEAEVVLGHAGISQGGRQIQRSAQAVDRACCILRVAERSADALHLRGYRGGVDRRGPTRCCRAATLPEGWIRARALAG